jgi:hypothetical protein
MPNKLPVNKWDMCKKADLKKPWKVPHMCPAKKPTRGINKENPNPKDGRLVTHKSSLMMLN